MMRPQGPMTGWGGPGVPPQGSRGSYGPPTSGPKEQQVPTYGPPPVQQQQPPMGSPYLQQGPPRFGPPPQGPTAAGQLSEANMATVGPGSAGGLGPFPSGPPGLSPATAGQTPMGQRMAGPGAPAQGFMSSASQVQRPGGPPMMGAPPYSASMAGGFQRGPPLGSMPPESLRSGAMGQAPSPPMRPMGPMGPSGMGGQQFHPTPQQHLASRTGGGMMGNGPSAPPSGMMGSAGSGPGPWGPPPGALAAPGTQPGAGVSHPPLPPSMSQATLPDGTQARPDANPFFRSPPPMGPPTITGPPGPRAMGVGPPPRGPPSSASPYGTVDPQPGVALGSGPQTSRSLPPGGLPPPPSQPPYMSPYTQSTLQPPTKQMERISLGPPASAPPPPAHSMGPPGHGSLAPMTPPSQAPTMMHPSVGAPGLGQSRHVYSDPYGPGVPGSVQPPSASLGVANSPAAHGSVAGPRPPASRIDPNTIPRPVEVQSSPEVFQTRVNRMATTPPPATSHFVAKDTGNCNPRFMRCTLNQIPVTEELLTKSGMPLALMVQPLALPDPEEDQIPVIDFGESGPVRCSRCKAYMNPFMKFVDSGRRFQCNLCGAMNETPRSYFCNLGPDMRRRDADERPELCKGTVEYVATREYMVRPPMAPTYFFLIDVSVSAVSSGMTACVCNAICKCLSEFPESSRTMVGIATFDSTIHFYNLNPSLSQPAMLVVPDVDDVYTPQPSDLIVPLHKSRDHIVALLESIPSIFQNTRIAESAFGAAVQGAYIALKPTGGRLLAFQSVLPSIGVGALRGRESEAKLSSMASGEKKDAHKLLLPADPTFKKLAVEFAEFQVSVDLFITSQAYVDVASLAVLPKTTGGQIYFYYPFTVTVDSPKIYNDLRWNITRPQGLEAVLRVRCSQGLMVQDYHGNFCKRISTDVDLPSIDCDKSIMVTFKHDDKFQDGEEACFQCALLYTTVDGQRRIRVHTLSLACTSALANLFRWGDLYTQFAYFLKQAAEQIVSTPLATVRENIVNLSVNVLHAYRKNCATSTAAAQLILPEALKLLPLYTLALQKSVGLRPDALVDERAYWLARVSSLSTALSIPLVYPRMFALHDLPSEGEDNGGVLPSPVHLSSEKLEHEGIFLLENGEDAYLWVGKGASPDRLYHLFGVQSVDEISPGHFVLKEYDNEHSKRLHAMLNQIRRQRCSYLRLRVVRHGDPLEHLFYSYLVEDKMQGSMSYVEFLCHVHRQIQSKLAGAVN
ncbi:hypothetical protein CBR_g26046 [Chara braunii]|uniref:Uncharacterized protein n=1 Tax=Chara braunii TaxID=69332 RepID=A0A388L730_CHABU|nr:hypothetical protein CBR_g26046 [Chara braunii]|eukprot:GBG78109.1 hypothetical protein CBR_g26046 [Chara braunii]